MHSNSLGGVLRTPLSKPIIYFAGKIAARDDWRAQIVGKRPGGLHYADCSRSLFDSSYKIDFGSFWYGGPFFVSCDHGCAHGPGDHGAGATGDNTGCLGCIDSWGDELSTPRRVFHVNRQRIARADIVFAYINELDCHGTLIELGMAAELYKQIIVCFGPQLTPAQTHELWMARMCAARVYERCNVATAWWTFNQLIAETPF